MQSCLINTINLSTKLALGMAILLLKLAPILLGTFVQFMNAFDEQIVNYLEEIAFLWLLCLRFSPQSS